LDKSFHSCYGLQLERKYKTELYKEGRMPERKRGPRVYDLKKPKRERIVYEFKNGMTTREIAAQEKCSVQNISEIRRRIIAEYGEEILKPEELYTVSQTAKILEVSVQFLRLLDSQEVICFLTHGRYKFITQKTLDDLTRHPRVIAIQQRKKKK
jgi:DNA-binding CsgD family transcriptional regulator